MEHRKLFYLQESQSTNDSMVIANIFKPKIQWPETGHAT